jgi:isopenicillin N synthase-like dioxygenase
MAIPIVDFGKFQSENYGDKREVALQIDEAFRNVGFVYLKNHSVPLSIVEECFRWVNFFETNP